MKLSGWGRYPVIDAARQTPPSAPDAARLISASSSCWIPRGLGRSYGDSALSDTVIATDYLDGFISFDETTGLLRCAAGVSLDEVIRVFLPRGWFLPVTPGSRFVTVGGAVASDVHGKNHHGAGTFCQHVHSLLLLTPSLGEIVCSPSENADIFHATCGGMGLTGLLLEVVFQLIPVNSSSIEQRCFKAENLNDALALFEEHSDATYSVAWIDCLARGSSAGRSLVLLGEHSDDGSIEMRKEATLAVPFDAPAFALNSWSIRAFNTLYYHRVRKREQRSVVHYEPYFYPLDGIKSWNRMYGRHGFVQYQFVTPKSAGIGAVESILEQIAEARKGSFLAVLKAFGAENDNYLSFPTEGYTVALDFKMEPDTLAFLERLDAMVLAHGGRVYLAKDARMSEAFFKAGYPRWEDFMAVREKCDPGRQIQSLQSRRLGL